MWGRASLGVRGALVPPPIDPIDRRRAFGVEPDRRPYRLRLARYVALAETIVAYEGEHRRRTGERLRILDAGAGRGRSLRYLEPWGIVDRVDLHAVDISSRRIAGLYAPGRWRSIVRGDLAGGLSYRDDSCDIVVCEQVIEHLDAPRAALRELCRVLRPGGLLIVGAPSFPPGLAGMRRTLGPVVDALLGRRRSHLQTWTTGQLCAQIAADPQLRIVDCRGFRIVSGGVLAPLEGYRWWYRWNRRLGQLLPSLCVETQVVAAKTAPP